MTLRISDRAQSVAPFYVMQVAKRAQALAADLGAGQPRMLYLNIGEPDFTAPPPVQAAAQRAIEAGLTQYTPALGLPALRERISAWYAQRHGLDVPARRIVVTAGASAGLQLACLALFNPGDEVLMPDPSYPCNRHILASIGARARLLSSAAANRFQLDPAGIAQAWSAQTAGVLIASPSNPTGTSVDPQVLRDIHAEVRARGGMLLMDEIYQGLSFDERYGQTALALGEDVVSINSFSKYFSMTGWRLGWLVLPDALVDVVERLAQNLYICASTVAQHAALACFEPESLAIYEERRAAYRARRDAFIPGLRALGFDVPVMPDGAFYAWADASALFDRLGVHDSAALVERMMRETHVVATPSVDFSEHDRGTHVRFSTASSMEDLTEALQRLQRWLA